MASRRQVSKKISVAGRFATIEWYVDGFKTASVFPVILILPSHVRAGKCLVPDGGGAALAYDEVKLPQKPEVGAPNCDDITSQSAIDIDSGACCQLKATDSIFVLSTTL